MEKMRIFSIAREQTESNKTRVKFERSYPITAIHYITKGKGFFNGHKLQEGDGFVCFKNGKKVDYYPDKSDPWEYVYVTVQGDNITNETCFCDCRTGLFKFVNNKQFEDTVRYIFKSQFDFCVNEMFAAACVQLMLSMHIIEKVDSIGMKKSEKSVELAKKYIQSNFHLEMRVEDVAKKIFVSSAYLRRIFCKYEGISPQQYIINIRLNRAKVLLKTSDLSTYEIADAVGYADVAQFYKIFQKKIGVTPSQYRKDFAEK